LFFSSDSWVEDIEIEEEIEVDIEPEENEEVKGDVDNDSTNGPNDAVTSEEIKVTTTKSGIL